MFVADTFAARLLGLALLDAVPLDGLLITRCSTVHTIGMRFAIDVVFLRLSSLEILDIRPGVPRGRAGGLACRRDGVGRRDAAALELVSGRAEALGLRVGSAIAQI